LLILQIIDSPIYIIHPDFGVYVEQTTVSSRIPEPLNASLEEAANSRGAFRSEIVRRALRYYVEQNPDDIPSLDETGYSSMDTVSSLQQTEGN
jgi:metal-responsive CopG/Arc/MetJ family transcriptional regulator